MAKSLLRQRVEKHSLAQRLFVRRRGEVAVRIQKILEDLGWSQHDLARKTQCKDSYISRVLSGSSNLTLKSITKIEAALGQEILTIKIPQTRRQRAKQRNVLKVSSGSTVSVFFPSAKTFSIKMHNERKNVEVINISLKDQYSLNIDTGEQAPAWPEAA